MELNYRGKDEVGELTESFRKMRDHLKLYISDLNSKAYSDALTGIKNKAAFDIVAGRLNRKISQGDGDTEFAIVMFDCNRLKTINDRYSHERGDDYLQAASTAICQVYSHSPVFRLAGMKFAAVLQRQDYKCREELIETFDRVCEEINAKAENPWEKVSLARGMHTYEPGKDQDVEQVLHLADKKMYEDKRQRRFMYRV